MPPSSSHEKKNRELRSHKSQLPETVRKLQKLERENEALQERVRHLEEASQTVHGTPRNISSPRDSNYSADIRQNPDLYFVADLRERLEMLSQTEPLSNNLCSVYVRPER